MCLFLKTFSVVEWDRLPAFDAGDHIKKVQIDVVCKRLSDHVSSVIVVFDVRLQMGSDLCSVIVQADFFLPL